MTEYTSDQRRGWIDSLDKRAASAAVVIENYSGEVLALKANYKRHWSLPGGVIDAGESPLQAAIRETKEETGIDLEPGELSLFCVAHRQSVGRLLYQFVFLTKLDERRLSRIVLQASEIESHKFVTRQQILENTRDYQTALQLWARGESGYMECEMVSQDEKTDQYEKIVSVIAFAE